MTLEQKFTAFIKEMCKEARQTGYSNAVKDIKRSILRKIDGIFASLFQEPEKTAKHDNDIPPILQSAKREFRRPPFRWEELGIPIGAKLRFKYDDSANVMVGKGRSLIYKGKAVSLQYLTHLLCGLRRNPQKYQHPYTAWYYQGKSLKHYFEQAYGRKN